MENPSEDAPKNSRPFLGNPTSGSPLTNTPRGYIIRSSGTGDPEKQGGKNDMAETEACCCSGKTKHRTEEEATALIHRLNRIEGQIRGMVERSAYCTDILVQCSAVTAAMNAFNRELLASHIRSCVADDIRAGKDEVIDELVATLQKLMK